MKTINEYANDTKVSSFFGILDEEDCLNENLSSISIRTLKCTDGLTVLHLLKKENMFFIVATNSNEFDNFITSHKKIDGAFCDHLINYDYCESSFKEFVATFGISDEE